MNKIISETVTSKKLTNGYCKEIKICIENILGEIVVNFDKQTVENNTGKKVFLKYISE